jgi:hypothetical protein
MWKAASCEYMSCWQQRITAGVCTNLFVNATTARSYKEREKAFQTVTNKVNRSVVARSKMSEVTTDMIEGWLTAICVSQETLWIDLLLHSFRYKRRMYMYKAGFIQFNMCISHTLGSRHGQLPSRRITGIAASNAGANGQEASLTAESALVLHYCYRCNILVPAPIKWRKLQNRTQRSGARIFILSILVSASLL